MTRVKHTKMKIIKMEHTKPDSGKHFRYTSHFSFQQLMRWLIAHSTDVETEAKKIKFICRWLRKQLSPGLSDARTAKLSHGFE